MLKEALIWRKNMDLHNMQANQFPQEFYIIGGLFSYENDLDGNPVIYLRIRMHRKIVELQDPIKQFLFFTIFQIDEANDSKGLVIVFDCSGAGYSNMDMEMLKNISEVGYKYFPLSVKYVIVYELPWILNAIRRAAMAIIPSNMVELVRFASKSDITNYIPLENLPDYMGGTCKRNYRQVPENCSSVEQLALEKGFSREDVERLLPQFEPYLSEAYEAIRVNQHLNTPEKLEHSHSTNEQANSLIHDQVDIAPKCDETLCDFKQNQVSVVHKNSKFFTKYASVYPQNELFFVEHSVKHLAIDQRTTQTTLSAVVSATILIRNNQQAKMLSFKVQSSKPDHYTVTPSLGVVTPGALVCIQVVLKAGTKLDDIMNDKFLILMIPDNINSERVVTSIVDFNRMFVEHIDKVHTHRLRVKIDRMHKQALRIDSGQENESVRMHTRIKMLENRCLDLERQRAVCGLAVAALLVLAIILAFLVFGSDTNTVKQGLLNCYAGAKAYTPSVRHTFL